MPDALFEQARERQKQLGYGTFSDYIQAIVRADSIQGTSHVREAAPGKPLKYPPPKRPRKPKA